MKEGDRGEGQDHRKERERRPNKGKMKKVIEESAPGSLGGMSFLVPTQPGMATAFSKKEMSLGSNIHELRVLGLADYHSTTYLRTFDSSRDRMHGPLP
ncbi:MAG: hypothetical protein CV088_02600 [Nitrospira sp. LK70]|nr:hypothetical protein [Nitrospira sp. LK70]